MRLLFSVKQEQMCHCFIFLESSLRFKRFFLNDLFGYNTMDLQMQKVAAGEETDIQTQNGETENGSRAELSKILM